MPYRRYNRILAAVIVPVVLVLAATSLFLQPYDGGLTRLGGYPEKLYGWNAPQQRFAKPLYRQFKTREAGYREPADVVVFGDSFTFLEQVSWPNYFVKETGLRLQSFRIDKTPIERILESDTFRNHPPRIVIYESVERALWERSQRGAADCRIQPRRRSAATLRVAPLPIEPEPFRRDTHSALLNFSLSIDFLAKVVPREYLGRDRTPVARLALTRPMAFSNIEASRLLVYKDDLDKARWTPEMWEKIRCNLANLQNRVQANGYTFFVALVATDKLSAYSDWLEDQRLARLSRYDLLAADPGLHLPRVDLALKAAVRNNVLDVYLNNDTHWGANGYALVAHELTEYLVRAGVLAPVVR
jgi:hypothetical protein